MSHPTPTRIRLSPAQRRTQLLDLGVRLLATRTLDELTIDLLAEQAGVSRGLLYHYFGSKQAFHEALVRRAVDDLVEQTAPPPGGDPLGRLLASVTVYVDYVGENYEGFASILKAAQGGNESLRALCDEARTSLTDRIFTEDAQGEIVPDNPGTRLMVRGWAALAEELAMSWAADPAGVTRDELVAAIAGSLPVLVALEL